jgi:hypothetical protein
MRCTGLLLLAFALLAATAGAAEPEPWFTNVAPDVGLAGVRAKDAIFADLNDDGYWDLCLDRRHLYLSQEGKRFVLVEESGIEFPEVRVVPLQDGKPNEEKAKVREYVPQYLYFADLDNDGHQDAVWGVKSSWETLTRSGWKTVEACDPGVRSRVYLGTGTGTFEPGPASEFTSDAACGPVMALALVDVDADGNLDLFEGRDYRQYGQLYGCGVDRLWKGDGKGRFIDRTEEAGLLTVPEPATKRSSRPTYGVTHADLDNDGDQDLLALAYGRQWNRQWRNDGNGHFTEVGHETGFAGDDITHGRYPDWVQRPAEQPFRANGNTFDCAVGDHDNDGDLDLFLGCIKHAWAGESSDPPSLLINQGAEQDWSFERVPVMKLLPPRPFRDSRNYQYGDLHVAWLDVDNDTRLDLLIASGDYPDGQFLRLYHQQEDGSFQDVTEAAGFDWEGCGDISIGDYDQDGDLDILAGRSFMRLNQKHRDRFMGGITINEVALFRNDIANRSGNHSLVIQLVDTSKRHHGNRTGIGARIEVTTGDLTQIREIRSGSGLANHQDPPEAHVGLGRARKADRVVIRWPDRQHTEQVLEDVEAGRHVIEREP